MKELGIRKDLTKEYIYQDSIAITFPKLVIMVGLPRSGKTTAVEQYIEHGYIPICADDFRRGLGTQFNSLIEPFVHAATKAAASALLIRGLNVVIDETNLTEELRKGWFYLGQRYDAFVYIDEVETPSPDELKQRCEDSDFSWDLMLQKIEKYEFVNEEEHAKTKEHNEKIHQLLLNGFKHNNYTLHPEHQELSE